MRSYYDDELSILESGNRDYFIDDDGNYVSTNRFGLSKEQVLEQYQERANRLNAVSAVYQRADRIITGQDITVTVNTDPEVTAPASNTGKTIELNASLIDDVDSDSIIALHGLNYHEVSHVLFSPRAGSDLARYVKANEYKRAFFMLEESRAENLLVTKYPITRLFLEASVMRYLLNNPETISGYFPLVTGRKYLPLEIRQKVADMAVTQYGMPVVTALHKIIHEYRTLVFPRDFDRAKELVAECAKIIGTDTEPPLDPRWDIGEDLITEGRPANTKEQERLQERAKKGDTPSEQLAEKHRSQEGGSDEQYKGEDVTFTDKDSELVSAINKRLDEIKNDKVVSREVSDTRKAILGSDEMRLALRPANKITRTVSPKAQVIARKFGQELERLVLDQDPAWDKERAYGKLIPSRAINPDINNIGRMFDRWDIGNEATDIEAVVLLDNSSSMNSLMTPVCENAWVIKRGIEKIYGNVTTYSFNHESRLLSSSDSKAKPSEYDYVYSNGNTNPIRALIESERQLSTSKRPIKLLFIVTDGEWYMDTECDSVIKSMNDKGIFTCVVYLDDRDSLESMRNAMRGVKIFESDTAEDIAHREAVYRDRYQRISHGAKMFKAVSNPKDLLALATSLVKELITHERVA